MKKVVTTVDAMTQLAKGAGMKEEVATDVLENGVGDEFCSDLEAVKANNQRKWLEVEESLLMCLRTAKWFINRSKMDVETGKMLDLYQEVRVLVMAGKLSVRSGVTRCNELVREKLMELTKASISQKKGTLLGTKLLYDMIL
jgi:hypothetical protein